MPEYRNVKKPTGLIARDLTEAEAETVKAGNEAAVGTGIDDGKHASQLDLWYQSGATLVSGKRDGKPVTTWAFKGYVSPEDCREWYLASING